MLVDHCATHFRLGVTARHIAGTCFVCAIGWLSPVAAGQCYLGALTASDVRIEIGIDPPVAIGDGLVLAGAPTDVNEHEHRAGSVVIFRQTELGWQRDCPFTLRASDGADGDQFGNSVAIHTNHAIIGAPYRDDNGENTGAVYIFQWDETCWIELPTRLYAPSASLFSLFGNKLAVAGDRLFVVAPEGQGEQSAGRVYVFHRSGDTWNYEATLSPSGGAPGDGFGTSLSAEGDTVVVGAFFHDASGVEDAGAAYVFRYNGATWEQIKLTAPVLGHQDRFGASVAIHANRIVVGSQWADMRGAHSGLVHVFRRDGAIWTLEAQFIGSGVGPGDEFGYPSLALECDRALVAAGREQAMYSFRRKDGAWVEDARLPVTGMFIGDATAIRGGLAAVSSNATPGGPGGHYQLAVYLFDLTACHCDADFNNDAFVNSQDFFDFLAVFFVPCP